MRLRVQKGEEVPGGQALRRELLQVLATSAYFVGVNYTGFDMGLKIFLSVHFSL